VFLLLAQDVAQKFHVFVVELPIARRGSLGFDQALAFEETNLGNRHIGEFLEEKSENLPDGEIRSVGSRP
jgi:hypothetical protein